MKSTLPRLHARRAFTLVELLVVLAVIGILLSLMLPAVQQARESARRITCANNLRQLGLGMHQYHDLHSCFPPGSQVADIRTHPFSKSFGWPIMLLPHVEQRNLYQSFDFNGDAQSPQHRPLITTILPIFVCPSDPSGGFLVESTTPGSEGQMAPSCYFGVAGTNALFQSLTAADCLSFDNNGLRPQIQSGVLFGNSSIRVADVTDGLSNTLMLGERGVVGQFGRWGGPGEFYQCPWGLADVVLPGTMANQGFSGGIRAKDGTRHDRYSWWSYHSGGVNFLLADGSLRFRSSSTDVSIQTAMSTRSGSEIIIGE
jgi:prepilin-type N-terminal cleavage/methylation domain-containing protein/prepilin-type processing-associated H-X9-DG protein